MAYKPPSEIARAGIQTGATKAKLSWDKAVVAGFLAGAYIAIAGLLAITVSAGMPERIWGTLPSFFTGAVFSLGLILVIIAGSELLTGNMALVPLAAMRGRATLKQLAENWAFVIVGNLLGALFVAYFLAVQSGDFFFIPAAIFAGVPDITWWDAVQNWIFAFLGNAVGAAIFVAGAYWFLYVREPR